MRLRDTLIIGLMVLLSLSMMQSESGRVVATEPAASDARFAAEVASAEIAALLAMAQEGSRSAPPRIATMTGDRPAPADAEVSARFVDECLEVAEQINPDWATRIRSICERSPEDFEQFIRSTGRRLVALVELKRRDPQLYRTKIDELRTEALINDIVHRLRHLHAEGQFESPEAEELKSELRVQIQNQVAYSLKARGDYIIRLEEHLAALRKQLESDALNFFRTVEDRYQTLTEME